MMLFQLLPRFIFFFSPFIVGHRKWKKIWAKRLKKKNDNMRAAVGLVY
jgi:hypothetical protein